MNIKNIAKLFKVVLLVFTLVSLVSCGMWTDFKTYFNTYYNAKELFVDAEEKLIADREELFYFEEKIVPRSLNDSFNKVIEKTSAILQHNKESDLVDDALIMTGKSFFYQQNYSRALRKFTELSLMQDSDLSLENKLWIGKTNLQMRDFELGLKNLDEVKNESLVNEEDDILIEAYKSKIGYLIYAEEIDAALDEMNELFEANIDSELKAEVLYEMGKLYKENKDFEAAEKVFADIENYSPSFDVDYRSKFEVAILKGELGNVDESLLLLNDLRDEDKFSDNWGEIDLEIGKIFYDRNQIEDALDKFTIVDTTYKKTESAGVAVFYRGEILENYYKDYDSAMAFYKTASTSLAPPSIRTAAQKKTRLLDQYIKYHNTLRELKIQYNYLTDEESFLSDSLDYAERFRQDSIKFAEANLNNSNVRGSRKPQFKPDYKEPVRPRIGVDSIRVLNSKNYFELANLLFSEFDDPDSAYHYYNLSLEEDPENPNEAQTYFAIGNYFLIKEDKAKADSMFTLIYDKFQFDPIRNEAAKQIGKPLYDFDKDPVEEEYAKAESIYYSKNYSKAINTLFDIYENNPKSIYASKSLYTIGFILENDLDKPDSAASIYKELQEKYRSSEYAKAIQIKLTGYKQEQLKKDLEEKNAQKENIENEEKTENIQAEESIPVNKNTQVNENDEELDPRVIEERNEGSNNGSDSLKNSTPQLNDTSKTDNTKLESSKKIVSEKKNNTLKNKTVEKKNDKNEFKLVGQDIYKTKDGYFIQVSSWKNKDIAEQEVKKLKNNDYKSVIHETYVAEKQTNYYRVKVGPYNSFQEAKNVRLKLNKY